MGSWAALKQMGPLETRAMVGPTPGAEWEGAWGPEEPRGWAVLGGSRGGGWAGWKLHNEGIVRRCNTCKAPLQSGQWGGGGSGRAPPGSPPKW